MRVYVCVTHIYTLYIHVIYIYYYTQQQENGLHKHGTNNPDRIKSYDFKSWDKYDVDREIEKDEDEEEEKNGSTKWKGISPKLTEKGQIWGRRGLCTIYSNNMSLTGITAL